MRLSLFFNSLGTEPLCLFVIKNPSEAFWTLGGPKSPKSSQKQPPPPHRGRGGIPKSVKSSVPSIQMAINRDAPHFRTNPDITRYYKLVVQCYDFILRSKFCCRSRCSQLLPSALRFFRCGTCRSKPTRLWRVSPWKAQQGGSGIDLGLNQASYWDTTIQPTKVYLNM
jgi:hypothetical protein